MIKLSYLPLFVRKIFFDLPTNWRANHRMIFMWMVLIQASAPNKKTIRAMSSWIPEKIAEWRMRRLLNSKYWNIHSILLWSVNKILNILPPPNDKTLYVIVDGSHKPKTGKKNPLAQKGKIKSDGAWFFGIKFVLIMFAWKNFRFPVSFRIVKKKNNPDYKTENELFREMLPCLPVPQWAKLVIVCGDAGFAAKENLKLISSMGTIGKKWGYIFSLPRNWNLKNGQKLRDIVKHINKTFFKKTWIPSLSKRRKRKYFFTFSKVMELNHIGEATILLSKKGYNVGPRNVKIIVTNLTNLTERSILSIYQRRWMVEVMFKELKSGTGLGDQQVTKDEGRIINSIGLSIVAYLFLFQFGQKILQEDEHWSIFKIQNKLRMTLIEEQLERNYEKKIRNFCKIAA